MDKNIEIRNNEVVEVTPEVVTQLSREEVIFKRDLTKAQIKSTQDYLILMEAELENLEQIIIDKNLE